MKKRILHIKRIISQLLTLLLCVSLTACGNEAESGKEDVGPSPTPIVIEDWDGEPCLSPMAQQKLQFAQVVPGETVAEIIVEGYGSIFVRFFPAKAPKAVENFLTHAREGYYDNTLLHRVIDDFMLQGGDPEGTGYGGESIYGKPFEDEIVPELEPFRGALCMANAGADTNESQFFLMQADAASVVNLKELVEYKGYTLQEYMKAAFKTEMPDDVLNEYMTYGGAPWLHGHHTVFGQIYDGFDVLDKLAVVKTDSKDRPVEDIVIKTIRIFQY